MRGKIKFRIGNLWLWTTTPRTLANPANSKYSWEIHLNTIWKATDALSELLIASSTYTRNLIKIFTRALINMSSSELLPYNWSLMQVGGGIAGIMTGWVEMLQCVSCSDTLNAIKIPFCPSLQQDSEFPPPYLQKLLYSLAPTFYSHSPCKIAQGEKDPAIVCEVLLTRLVKIKSVGNSAFFSHYGNYSRNKREVSF